MCVILASIKRLLLICCICAVGGSQLRKIRSRPKLQIIAWNKWSGLLISTSLAVQAWEGNTCFRVIEEHSRVTIHYLRGGLLNAISHDRTRKKLDLNVKPEMSITKIVYASYERHVRWNQERINAKSYYSRKGHIAQRKMITKGLKQQVTGKQQMWS